MKKFLVAVLLLALCMSLMACVKETDPAESPATEAATENTTEATQETSSKPIQVITGDTPLSSGSGCATSAAEVVE